MTYYSFTKILLIVAIVFCFSQPCLSATAEQQHAHISNVKKSLTHTQHSSKPAHAKTKFVSSHKSNKYKRHRPQRKKLAQRKMKKKYHNDISVSSKQTRVNTAHLTPPHSSNYFLTSFEKNLVEAVRKVVGTLRYSTYQLGGSRMDTSHGVYIVDCSAYVDHMLKTVYPKAYTSLSHFSQSGKPTSGDYYQYFMNLSDNRASSHWNTIDDVEQLRPGDILVFRYKDRFGDAKGHVMIVMDKPTWQGNAYLVRVTDSAPSGHSKDTRLPHTSGVGIGNLLLKVDSKTYQPYAYAWKIGAPFKNNVNFAMARPLGMEA